jgi:hypothetical protein
MRCCERLSLVGIAAPDIDDERKRMSKLAFGRTRNRSLLGTLNDFAFMAQSGDARRTEPESPEELMRFLSQTPILPLDGARGGVYQLARGVSKVWFERSARGPLRSPDRVTDVFPLLVVQDPILDCGPVVRVLSDRFAVAIERLRRRVKHKAPKIWPLTVVTADELDVLRANLGTSRHRLDAVLKSFHRRHPSRMVSLGNFLSSKESRTFGFPDSGRESVQQRFRSGADGSVQRFRDGEYGVAVDILGDVTPARGDSAQSEGSD